MRECDGRCDSGTALRCQMACKSRSTLWMLTLLGFVRLIECHKRRSSFHSVTVTAAALCFIGTVLNVLEMGLGTCSVFLGKLESFGRIRKVVESAESFVMSVCLPVRQHGKLGSHLNDSCQISFWE